MEKDKEIPRPARVGVGDKIIETYAEDMAEVLQDDKEGLIKKMIPKLKD